MNRPSDFIFEDITAQSRQKKLSHDFIALASDLLPLWDIALMLLSPFITNYVYRMLIAPADFDIHLWTNYEKQAL
ncbi:MAG: hypothetical protein M0P19_13765, partial [Nevskia sp.]|nr:hypothetical protein [Nevskia sp.]